MSRRSLALALLKRARTSACCYQRRHACAGLHEALGYSAGFSLIEAKDVYGAEGFIKGYGETVAQSLEAAVMRIVQRQTPQRASTTGSAAPPHRRAGDAG